MHLIKLKNSDDGVVGIVVTVLLIGLFMAVLVMVNTIYVPQWIEESEAAHMETVSNQFAKLKYVLDIQSVINDSTSMSTPITLGTKEIPFFDSGQSFDQLEIVENAVNITFSRYGTTAKYSYIEDIIKFSSSNSYFVDQSYIYEAGALIIGQEDSHVLFGKPSILVTDYAKNITMTIVNIVGINGKTSISGYGIFPIYTECINPNFTYTVLRNVTSISIQTDYPNAWKVALNNSLRYSGINYELNTLSDQVIINFIDPSDDYFTFKVREVDISTQISFGRAQ